MEQNLSKRQFFHGTSEDLPMGTILRPGKEIGKTVHGHSSHVYMAGRAEDAREWGEMATGNWDAYIAGGSRPTSHVYQVKPLGPVERDERGERDVYPEGTPKGAEHHRTTHAEIIGKVKF